MPNTTTPVIGKVALSNLKGNLALAKAKVIELARSGVDSDNAKKQVAVLEYAIASVEANVINNKSAFKELSRAKAARSIPLPAEDPGSYGDDEAENDD